MYASGTPVQYTNAWLYSTGQAPTGDACHYKGVVVDDPKRLGNLDPEKFVVVQWSHRDEPQLILAKNVAPPRTAKLLDIPSWVEQQERTKRAKARKR